MHPVYKETIVDQPTRLSSLSAIKLGMPFKKNFHGLIIIVNEEYHAAVVLKTCLPLSVTNIIQMWEERYFHIHYYRYLL